MEIIYSEKGDGLLIKFTDKRPNHTKRITDQITAHMHEDQIVMLHIDCAAAQGIDVATVISRYYTKDAPATMTVEVPIEEDE